MYTSEIKSSTIPAETLETFFTVDDIMEFDMLWWRWWECENNKVQK